MTDNIPVYFPDWSQQGRFLLLGTFDNAWRHFWLLDLGWGGGCWHVGAGGQEGCSAVSWAQNGTTAESGPALNAKGVLGKNNHCVGTVGFSHHVACQ